MHLLAADPFGDADVAGQLGAELVSLPALLEQADFVIVCCALTADTHHLIDRTELQRMKPTAHLINVTRGPIVDQAALTQGLAPDHVVNAEVLDTERFRSKLAACARRRNEGESRA